MIDSSGQQNERDNALDNFRGFCVLLVIFFFFFETLDFLPQFMAHSADGDRLTPTDFIASGFMFALAFANVISLERFKATGAYGAAVRKSVTRNFALIGIGFLMVTIQAVIDKEKTLTFNVLSAFGVAGLYSLFFIKCGRLGKLLSGIAIIVAYQFVLFIPAALDYVLANDFGGFLGAAAWCGYMLIISFAADVYRQKDFRKFTVTTVLCLGISVVFALCDIIAKAQGGAVYDFFIASKLLASMSFLFISLGVCMTVFWLFVKFTGDKQIPVLNHYGCNSLLTFIFAAGIGRGFTTLAQNYVTSTNVGYIIALGCVASAVICAGFSYLLSRFNISAI